MAAPTITTVRERIAWCYANLARADAALEEGADRYRRVHHIIRNKLYHGLVSGKMSMRSLYDDERLKMTAPQACYYCGSRVNLVLHRRPPFEVRYQLPRVGLSGEEVHRVNTPVLIRRGARNKRPA